jgi:hypothetical protein
MAQPWGSHAAAPARARRRHRAAGGAAVPSRIVSAVQRLNEEGQLIGMNDRPLPAAPRAGAHGWTPLGTGEVRSALDIVTPQGTSATPLRGGATWLIAVAAVRSLSTRWKG